VPKGKTDYPRGSELAIEANIGEVRDIKKIMEYAILATPGLVIDEEVACFGRKPSKAELTTFITAALMRENNIK
jgi:hypothetical protein